MNKEINMLKISGYNDFKCTANKCKFTCCEGWDINIDKDTYERWEKAEKDSTYLLNGVKTKECNGKEKYFINLKIEKVKELIIYDELSFSEIADLLNYSSVAHLSNQFKKITGFTPTHFKQIKEAKRTQIDKL